MKVVYLNAAYEWWGGPYAYFIVKICLVTLNKKDKQISEKDQKDIDENVFVIEKSKKATMNICDVVKPHFFSF